MAVLLLREVKTPEAAAAYVEAATAAGFGSHSANSDTGMPHQKLYKAKLCIALIKYSA